MGADRSFERQANYVRGMWCRAHSRAEQGRGTIYVGPGQAWTTGTGRADRVAGIEVGGA